MLCSICGGKKDGTRCHRCTSAPERRLNANQRGYTYRWQKASLAYLSQAENRICAICSNRLSECVDHIVDHHGDMKLFWDERNWQPACIPCNTRKAKHDGTTRTTTKADGD